MDAALLTEIEKLRRATLSQLREKHRELFQEDTRSRHREHLFRRLAWRLQALAEGDLPERARQIARDADGRSLIAVVSKPNVHASTKKQRVRPSVRGMGAVDRRACIVKEGPLPPGVAIRRRFRIRRRKPNVQRISKLLRLPPRMYAITNSF